MNTIEDLELIVNDLRARKSEEEWYEFKGDWYEPKQLGEYISALSNSAAICGKEFAYFIWGISDSTHDVIGTNFEYNIDYAHEPYQNFLARNLSPSIAFEFHTITINDKRVVVLVIPAAKRVPTAFLKDRYSRIGSSKVNLTKYPEREALIWKVLSEGYPTMLNTESPVQDLTFKQFESYYRSKGLEFKENFRVSFNLYTASNKYNMLACYLADNGNIAVRVSMFAGSSKADRLVSVKEFGNESLISVIDRIIAYSITINLNRAVEHINGFREDITLFDQECFNEALKNAIIHNNWLHRAAPMITFYDNRVEIISFSSLAPNQTLEGFFRGDSRPVNEDLSVIFLATHISERAGKGVPCIVSKYGRGAFDIKENYIKVTLPYNFRHVSTGAIVSDVFEKLTQNEINVINLIKENPYISQNEIAQQINLGKTTVHTIIIKLKQLNYITRVGSNKNGFWKVNK